MNFDQHMLPVAFVRDVRGEPLQVWLGSTPVVLFRASGKLNAFEDSCPHRGAPLSAGSVRNGSLVCPYHGWAFDSTGANVDVPVRNGKVNCSLRPVLAVESAGMVWVGRSGSMPALDPRTPAFTFSGAIGATLLNTLENFLEGSHTHYVHDGLIRSSSGRRQAVRGLFTPTRAGFIVQYDAEPPKGWITRFTPRRFRNLRATSTFIFPSTAILEYTNEAGERIARIEAVLNPRPDVVEYFARVFIDAGLLTVLARWIMRPVFAKVLAQDKEILELQQKNLKAFPGTRFFSDETDVVGRELNYWFHAPERLASEPFEFIVYW